MSSLIDSSHEDIFAPAAATTRGTVPAGHLQRDRWKTAREALVCLSLANLLFLNVAKNLEDPSWGYRTHWGFMGLAAFGCNTLLMAAAVWLLSVGLSRTGSDIPAKAGRFLFFLLVLRSLDTVAHLVWMQARLPAVSADGALGRWLIRAAAGGLILFVLLRFERVAWRVGTTVLLVLSPLLPINAVLAARNVFASKVDSTPLPKTYVPSGRSGRVLVLIFDELDQRFTFAGRPSDVPLPELDRLRAESFYATSAYSPASFTIQSVPSMLTGRRVQAVTARPDDLLLLYPGATKPVPWSQQPNIFRSARQIGANTGLAGWYHPYCRILGQDLTSCVSVDGMYPDASNFTENLLDHYRRIDNTFTQLVRFGMKRDRVYSSRAYQTMHDPAIQMACDGRLQLVLLHWPIPHPPGIFNRTTHRVAAAGPANYLDNLILADKTLRELRMAMQQSGVWDRTSIIVTADHHYRADLWRKEYGSASELRETAGTGTHRLIPFLVHFAGSRPSTTYDGSFSGVLLHDIVLGILEGKLHNNEDLTAWLDQNRTEIPIDEQYTNTPSWKGMPD